MMGTTTALSITLPTVMTRAVDLPDGPLAALQETLGVTATQAALLHRRDIRDALETVFFVERAKAGTWQVHCLAVGNDRQNLPNLCAMDYPHCRVFSLCAQALRATMQLGVIDEMAWRRLCLK